MSPSLIDKSPDVYDIHDVAGNLEPSANGEIGDSSPEQRRIAELQAELTLHRGHH